LRNNSYLFVPGNEKKKIMKALDSKADVIIIDLEDAVPPEEKESARLTISEVLNQYSKQRNVSIRINEVNSLHWQEDLRLLSLSNVDKLVVPKVEEARDLIVIDEYLHSVDLKNYKLIPIIESAKGVMNLSPILQASRNIERLAFGSLDYLENIDGKLTEDEHALLFAKAMILNTSIAFGLASPIDCPYFDTGNTEGFKKNVLQNLNLGFKAKLLIHPNQIELLHEVIKPSESEVNEALEIIRLYEEAVSLNKGAFKYKGRMIDLPVYLSAQNTLLKANITEVINI